MSFLFSAGVLSDKDFQAVCRTFDKLINEGLLPPCKFTQETFGRFIFAMYQRGLCDEDKLYAMCRVAAFHKFHGFQPNTERKVPESAAY